MEKGQGSPLSGRYLVRHPILNGALRVIDSLLGWRRAAPPPIETPRRILVANIAHLGDALLATGALAALRQGFPDAHIGVLTSSNGKIVLQGSPFVDALHVFDHARLNRGEGSLWSKLRRHWATRRRALTEIRSTRYDVAIDLYPYFPNAIPLLWSAGIATRIGYTSGGFGPLLTHPVAWETRDWHVSRYHAHLLAQLPLPGFAPGPLPAHLPVAAEALRANLPRSYVVLHPGAGAAFKEWPLQNWRELAERLRQAGHHLVFTGAAPAEQQLVAALASGHPNCTDLSGQLDWSSFVSVVRGANLLVGVDSVAAHVAAAVGTPCVVLATGVPHPAHWSPLGASARVLRNATDCTPCYRSRGCAEMSCVRGISSDEAFMAALALLRKSRAA